jgi:vacuolar-type H+-ATPase subunit I/STV1
MDASRTFKDLLEKIEKSKLNYVIHKTPFSANISIKSSFIKWFGAPEVIENNDEDLRKLQNLGNIKLEEQLATARANEKNLEGLLNHETNKVKKLEADIGQFREEILTVKKDKKESSSKLKDLKSENKDLEVKVSEMVECIKDLEGKLDEKNRALKVKVEESSNFKKETKDYQERLEEALSELKKERLLDKKLSLMEFKCVFCDVKFESAVDCSKHVRENHVRDQVSQTTKPKENLSDKDDSYPCFYCGFYMTNSKDVIEHRLVCCIEPGLAFLKEIHQAFPAHGFSFPPPFRIPTEEPCYTCDKILENKVTLRNHYDTVHQDMILFWCEVCLTNFGSERGLKSHMRNSHKIFD